MHISYISFQTKVRPLFLIFDMSLLVHHSIFLHAQLQKGETPTIETNVYF
jgi:hypothetical protein